MSLPTGPVTLRLVPMPADTNPYGAVFGGWLMAQVDIAGAIVALYRASGPVVTVAVKALEFHQPVFVGDVLSLYAEIIATGTTSITVKVDVYAERNFVDPEVVFVTEATVTYVAIDENRRPRVLPERP